MRRPALLPSFAMLLLTLYAPRAVSPARPTASAAHPQTAPVRPDAAWMAEVSARIRDASHQFFADSGQLRAEVPERGLTARFDDAGAHIGSGSAGRPITVRAAGLGRAGSNATIVGTAPGLGDCQEGKADPEGHCVARLEYGGGGITEWWEAGSGGFEQGWVLTERPGGDGPVRIDVEVGGADAVVEGASVELRGDDGTTLSVSGLKAWDARGDDIPVRFERADDGFRVVVDDAGAVYPVEVDPVYTSADWNVEGAAGVDGFGDAVAGAGDTNGDGYDDVLVGVAGGETFLFLGSATGLGRVAATMVERSGSIGAAGDVNGDGYDDVLIGAWVYFGGALGLSDTLAIQASHSGVAAGDVNGDGYDDFARGYESYTDCVVAIYLGSSTGLGSSSSMTLDGGWCVTSVVEARAAAAGDVNGDGYGDVVLGCSCQDTHYDSTTYERVADYSGSVWVFMGSASGPSTSSWSSAYEQDYGSAVSGAGDVDGDGYDEVLVYAGVHDDDDDHSFAGRVYLLPGSAGGTLSRPSATIEGETDAHLSSVLSALGDLDGDGYAEVGVGANLYTGSSTGLITVPAITLDWDVYAAGDTNGDGYSDVIVGDASYDHGFGTDGAGAAWVYLGSATAPMETATQLAQTGDHLGTSLASADVNDDGYDDLVVGAYGYDGFRGEALVYHGSASGLGTVAVSTLLGTAPGDCFGVSVAAAGDTDGDGYDDVIVGAFGAGDYGAAYTYSGSASGLLATPSATLPGDATAPSLGYRVAGIGDADGDGYDDVAASTYPGANYVRTYSGAPSGTSPSATQSLSLSSAPSAIAGAGDVDGDGYGDLVIGCEEDDSHTGAASIYPGSSSGTVGIASTTLRGEDSNDHFGHTVAGAGDVDDDGHDDVVVGAYGNASSTGRIYVYHGTPTGLSPTVQTVLSGASRADAFGAWASGAGDRDGDGFDDIVVAAPGYGSGGVFVYPGSSSGVGRTATISATGYESLGDVLAGGDFNGDGLLDVVRGDSSSNLDGGEVSAWYGCIDADLDGYCLAHDCDDTDPAVNVVFYVDADGDGYGDPAAPTDVCVPTAGYAREGTDCDDTSAATHPGGTEVCDDGDTDEDCDGLADDEDSSATGQTTFYLDEDGDGYGGSATVLLCDGLDSTDCDDADADISPDATEVCDDIDNDCDGNLDGDAVDKPSWYADADSDGYTDPDVRMTSCIQPQDFAALTAADCDDADATINPGAVDIPHDGIDNNCDGLGPDWGHACGCATTTVPPSALGLMLLCAAFVRRRR